MTNDDDLQQPDDEQPDDLTAAQRGIKPLKLWTQAVSLGR